MAPPAGPLMRGRHGVAIAAAVALLLVVAASFPVVIAPSRHAVGASANDLGSIAWSLHHAAWSVAHGQLPIGPTNRLLFPQGGTIAVAALPQGILLAPVTWTAGAVVSFNLLQLGHLVLAAALGAWCARRMDADGAGMAILALATAASPAILAATFNQNPDVTAFWGLPLVAGLAWRTTRRGALLAGLAAGLVAWCNPYAGVMATLTGLAMLPGGRVVPYLAGVVLLGAPYVLAVLGTLGEGGVVRRAAGGLATTPLLWTVDPRPHLIGNVHWHGSRIAEGAYLGLSLLVLAIGRRGPLPLRRWGVLAVAGLLLALGPALALLEPGATVVPLPGALLEPLPGIGALRITSRFTALPVFALGLAAALAWTGHRWRWGAAALVAIDLLLVAGGLRMLRPMEVPFAEACAAMPALDAPVVLLPSDERDRALLLATCHGAPIAEGIKGTLSPQVRRALRAPPEALPEALRSAGIGHVLLADPEHPAAAALSQCPSTLLDGIVLHGIASCP